MAWCNRVRFSYIDIYVVMSYNTSQVYLVSLTKTCGCGCGWDKFYLLTRNTTWKLLTYSLLLGIGISCVCHNSFFNQIPHFHLINFIPPKIFKKLRRSSNQEMSRSFVPSSLASWGFLIAALLWHSLIDIMEFVESINNRLSSSRAIITLHRPLLHKVQIARIVLVFVILYSSSEPGQ